MDFDVGSPSSVIYAVRTGTFMNRVIRRRFTDNDIVTGSGRTYRGHDRTNMDGKS